jgi:Fe-Mn family superoxide dismutase
MIELSRLPYSYDALEPHISEEALRVHHGEQHRRYVDETNALLENTPFEADALEDIIRRTDDDLYYAELHQNAAQVWNHDFFWRSLSPKGGGQPPGIMRELIDVAFDSQQHLQDALVEKAAQEFASGYAWLVLGGEKLNVCSTPDAVPAFLREGEAPLLCIDLWEHAYYLDYRADRKAYVANVVEHLLDWEAAAQRVRAALDLRTKTTA